MPSDLILGHILLGRYRPLRLLGTGAHGRVFLAEDLVRGGERVALKLVEGLLGSGGDDPAQRELRWFRHPAWAEILDGGRFGQYDWFQATRYVEGPSLEQLEGAQPIEAVWRFLEDGARVLRALHRRGLIHYDVTPGNWLVQGPAQAPSYVLTDGGLAHLGPVNGFGRGSPMYMAPEVTEDKPHDHRVDLYSLGLVAYRLATGEAPHTGGAGDVLGRRRRDPAPHAGARRVDLPAALDAIIADLLAPDPVRRLADGDALLARLAEARPGTLNVLPAEAVAAATSGSLVGRNDVLERFGRSLRALAQHLPSEDAGASRPRPAPEPVLLLEGPPGAGATRLARELATLARQAEIPVLLLAGREGTPDRRNPLRRLVDGLVTLERPKGVPLPAAVLAPRAAGGDADTSAHAEGRAIERFLVVIEETAARSPLVLVVEDFSDLPPLAQEAVRVLSRHLLGRAERVTGQTPLPLTIVVDLGQEPAERLVNADAVDPRHAVASLGPLDLDAISALCRDRFPGLDLPQADLTALLAASDGQPAHLATLLGEAYRRGDLVRDTGSWSWDTSRLASYGPVRRLPPAIGEALRAAGPALGALLDRLALAEAEVPQTAVRALWSRLGAGEIPSSPLLSVREHGDAVMLALAAPTLRRALLAQLEPGARRAAAEDLLSALEAHPDPRTLLDRLTLRIELDHPEDALALAYDARAQLTTDQRQALQPLLLRIAHSAPPLLDATAPRSQLIALLDRGNDAAALARLLAPRLPQSADELPNVLLVARVLDGAYDFVLAATLLKAHAETPTANNACAAEIQVSLARALFALRRPTDAATPLARARDFLRRLRPRTRQHRRLVVDYLKVVANDHYDTGRLAAARHALEAARRMTRPMRAHALHVTVLNNLGLVHRAAGNYKAAERVLEHAVRLRVRLGDLAGTINGQYNLALLHLDDGSPARAAARLQEAARMASRHGRLPQLIAILGQLGIALDQQYSPAPALACLGRALRVAALCDQVQRAAQVAYHQAPLAAVMGAPEACQAALLFSASAARKRAFRDARGLHHLAVLSTALVLGQVEPAKRAFKRASRHAATLQGTDRTSLALLGAAALGVLPQLAGATSIRPLPGERLRNVYRLTVHTLRASTRCAAEPRGHALLHDLGSAPLSMGPAERRIALEVVLRQYMINNKSAPSHLWRGLVETFARLAGGSLQAARFAAHHACLDASLSLSARAEAFSRALAHVPMSLAAMPRSLRAPPAEHVQCARSLAQDGKGSLPDNPTPSDLHALAHSLLLAADRPQQRGARREEALRQVLAATSRMEPRAQLEALLERLTRSTAEITGAQRACVVLIENDPPGQMRVATSVTAAGGPITDQDLSHTVIQRVLASRKPLLLHDAFGDDELLGRPSITALALRSILCVPMLRDGALLGVMYADSSAGAGSFDQADLEVLTLLADQAAAAIETNRLVSKLQKAYAEVRTMQDRLVKTERLRVLGEVSSGVAHEFNNLLTAILARVQLMGLSVPDQEQRAHLALIEKATLDAAGVVRPLQSFSRQQRTNTFVSVLVAEVCTDAIEFLRPLWGTRRRHGRPPISVRLSCEPGLRVVGNPTELREVLTNLLKNALDALADRGGLILVQVATQTDGIEIRVHDDGPGIPPEIMAKVFDPFFTTKGEGGTGLGLCLSQRIAEQHGGELTLDSSTRGGTTATLRLPVRTAMALPDGGSAAGPVSQLGGKSVRILIVDDDSDVLRPLCSYLERSGYEVAGAKDAFDALEQMKADAPDVLLTDIGMPNMDGLELCRRAMALQPELPVVLMSGWASDVDPAEARAAGAKGLLAKPFAMQQVSALLRKIAEAASSSRQ